MKKGREWKRKTFFVVGPASSRTHGAGLAGCGARCICNEGMRVSDNRCIAPTGCARCIKPPVASTTAERRLSRSRSRRCYLSSPGHWNAIPRADDLYLASARPRGRMSHVPSLCLYRSSRKYPAAREWTSERGLTRTFIRATSSLRIKTGANMADRVPKNNGKCGLFNTHFTSRWSKILDNLRIVLVKIHYLYVRFFVWISFTEKLPGLWIC